MSHILLRALCWNEPKFSTLSWVKIYTYICIYTHIQIYVFVYIYTHLWCDFASELSKIIILMQNQNLAFCQRLVTYLMRKVRTFWIYSETPKLVILEVGGGMVALQTLYTAVQMKTQNTWALNLENHHALCTSQRSFSQYCTPVFFRPINYVPEQHNYNLSHTFWWNASAQIHVYFNCFQLSSPVQPQEHMKRLFRKVPSFFHSLPCKTGVNIFTGVGRRRKINREGNVIEGGMENVASLFSLLLKPVGDLKATNDLGLLLEPLWTLSAWV